MSDLDLQQRALDYARNHELKLTERLGSGTDGSVWLTNRKSAVKVFQSQKNYFMELSCYQRLMDHGITKLGKFAVPRLIESDNRLLVIEMSVVTPPHVLDFGKAYLDRQPEYSDDAWANYYQEMQERWEDKLPEVQALLGRLQLLGIYYVDPKPGNIMFEDWNE